MNIKIFKLALGIFCTYTSLTCGVDWFAFVPNNGSDTVSVFDITNPLIPEAPIAVDPNPYAVAITPDGKTVYVTNQVLGTSPVAGSVSIISLPLDQVSTILLNSQTTPQGIAITPAPPIGNDLKAYICGLAFGSLNMAPMAAPGGHSIVMVLNLTTNAQHPILLPVNSFPEFIAITPDAQLAYTTNGDGTISQIDTVLDTLITTFPTGLTTPELEQIAITPDGTKAYIADKTDDQILILNIPSNTFDPTPIQLPLNSGPCGIAITRDGSKVYVTNTISNNVYAITNNSVSATIPPSGVSPFDEPYGIAISPDGKKAYVTNQNSSNVIVIDIATDTIDPDVFVAGSSPAYLAITPDQAPTADFTATTAKQGTPTTFDASASSSPTGQIATFAWDFGDGSTGSGTNPSHTYALAGNYNVMLTVTNTAGTSTASSTTFTGQTVSNNGGPSAAISQIVQVTQPTPPPPPKPKILPPINGNGHQTTNRFLTQTEFVNSIKWQAPSAGLSPIEYRIYRDSSLAQFVATIPAGEFLKYTDHNRHKNTVYTYYVVSVSATGKVSKPLAIVVQPK